MLYFWLIVSADRYMTLVVKKSDAVRAYGSKAKLAKTLGVTRQAISQWGDYLPELQAMRLIFINDTIPHQQKTLSA